MGKPIKSKYKPSNPEKYMGDPNNIICRSSWERHFCHWCDIRPDIVKWASEEFSIPYVSPADGKVHRYYPDALIQKSNGKRYIIEIKPKRQTRPPVSKSGRQTKSFLYESLTYRINMAKWAAAEEFAKDNGVEFLILTEDELGIKQYGRGTGRVPKKRHKKNG